MCILIKIEVSKVISQRLKLRFCFWSTDRDLNKLIKLKLILSNRQKMGIEFFVYERHMFNI